MNYRLIQDLIQLAEDFQTDNTEGSYPNDITGFKQWFFKKEDTFPENADLDWEGKDKGRTPESVISTLLVHLNRYARMYSRSAMHGSDFSTQEEFVYLINLKAFGTMTKTELIRKNIQDKPVGMQIISRLIRQGWVAQHDSSDDRRSKLIRITVEGLHVLERQMGKIRQATQIVSGDLSKQEKMQLIRLLDKLDKFHHPVFERNVDSSLLLSTVASDLITENL